LSYKLKIWSCIVLEWKFLQAGTEKASRDSALLEVAERTILP
jgi:hypothetical protein